MTLYSKLFQFIQSITSASFGLKLFFSCLVTVALKKRSVVNENISRRISYIPSLLRLCAFILKKNRVDFVSRLKSQKRAQNSVILRGSFELIVLCLRLKVIGQLFIEALVLGHRCATKWRPWGGIVYTPPTFRMWGGYKVVRGRTIYTPPTFRKVGGGINL